MRIILKYFVSFIILLVSSNIGLSKEKFVLVIDPGHGGRDPGALSRHSKKYKHEKDLVLDISLRLGKYISSYMKDVEIIYTRDTDKFISLKKRSEIANKHKANLFISIHCNSHGSSKKLHGAETYVMGVHKSKENLEVAKKENSVIKFEKDYSTKYQGFDTESPESLISMSLLQNAFMDNSLFFASNMQKEFKSIGRVDKGVRQAGFYVISFNSMPSVLIECGYLTNRKEEKFLNTISGRKKISYSIYKAFKKYKSHFDKEKYREEKIIKDATKNTIEYKIQVLATSKKLTKNNKLYKDFSDITEYKEKKLYKYLIGGENSIRDISKLKKKVIKKGYKNIFVVAFKDGKKIPLSKAVKLSK